MASEFKAFDPLLIVTEIPKKVQDLVFWEGKLLTSLVDGTLLVIGPSDSAESTPGLSWQVQRVLKGFGRKYLLNLQVGCREPVHACGQLFHSLFFYSLPVSMMPLFAQIVPSRNALLSASDEGINLHTLPRLQLTAQVHVNSMEVNTRC